MSVEKHPSYGVIRVSRIHGDVGNLFGSSAKHHNAIRITISHAELHRELNRDWHFARNEIIELDLSPNQFAQMICSQGFGDGTPCTIRWIKGEGSIPAPVFTSKREQFLDEFQDRACEVGTQFNELLTQFRELLDKPSVTKKERQELFSRLSRLQAEISSNMPFIAKQFDECMDNTLNEVKMEGESFLTQLLIGAGLEKLGTMLQLEDNHEHGSI